MSIQRIDIPKKRTHGWQARVPLCVGKRLTKFLPDSRFGGIDGAHGAALIAEHELWRSVGKKPKALRG